MTFCGLFTTLHGDCEDRVEVLLSVKKADREPEQRQKTNQEVNH